MENKVSVNEKIILPKNLYEQLQIEEGEVVEVTDIARNQFTIRAVSAKPIPEFALRWFIVPTLLSILGFLIALFVVGTDLLPLNGNSSIAQGVLIIANSVALVTFITAYILKRQVISRAMPRKIFWRTFPTIIISLILISWMTLISLFWFVGQIFYGVQFDKVTAIIIFAMFSGILNFTFIYIVDKFSIRTLVRLLLATIIVGFVSSMATSGHRDWWQTNFSFLGTSKSQAWLQFNLTLIVTAVILFILFDYLFVALADKYGQSLNLNIMRFGLMLMSVSIGIVGLIPNNGEDLMHRLHDWGAYTIFIILAPILLGIRWLLKQAPKNFYSVTYLVFGIGIALSFLFYSIHYISLTAYELVGFAVSFSWFFLLINTLLKMIWGDTRIYEVQVDTPPLEKQ